MHRQCFVVLHTQTVLHEALVLHGLYQNAKWVARAESCLSHPTSAKRTALSKEPTLQCSTARQFQRGLLLLLLLLICVAGGYLLVPSIL